MFIELTTDSGSPVLINIDAIVEVQPQQGGGTWITVLAREPHDAISVTEEYENVRDLIRRTI